MPLKKTVTAEHVAFCVLRLLKSVISRIRLSSIKRYLLTLPYQHNCLKILSLSYDACSLVFQFVNDMLLMHHILFQLNF